MVFQEYMDAHQALITLSRHRVTAVCTTPHITNAILDHPQRHEYDLSTIKKGYSSGTPTDFSRVIRELGVAQLISAFASTETQGLVTATAPTDSFETKATTCGRPLPTMQVTICDPNTHNERPPGEPGEIVVTGSISRGYWNDPENTAITFRDGAYHSGDLGFVDHEGRLHFLGRIKQMIKTGGISVAPLEVEAFLATHPAVGAAYVVGVPEPEMGEIVGAAIVPAPGANITVDDVIEFCRPQIASYKIPHRVLILADEQVPRTSTGKVSKPELAVLLLKA